MGNIVDSSLVKLKLGLATSSSDEEDAIVSVAIRGAESAVRKFLKYDPVKRTRTEYYPQQDVSQSYGRGIWEANTNDAYLRRVSEAATDMLQVRHIPIRSDVAIQVFVDYDGRFGTKSGAFAAETEKTEGTDFWPQYDGNDDDGNAICLDGIIRAIGLWPVEPGAVKVVYSAGYSTDELCGTATLVDAQSIQEVVIDEAVRRFKKVMASSRKHVLAGHVAGPITSENLGKYSYSVDASMAADVVGSKSDFTQESMMMLEEYVNMGFMLGG